MLRKQLIYKNSTLFYTKVGYGEKVSFCFHGYGENAESFSFLSKYFSEEYCFIALDLPFHGQTVWSEGLLITPEELKEIVFFILEKENIQIVENNLTLIGFSLGGRVALSLFELIPKNINKLILLAPDGLKMNFWFWLATQTFLGNKLFSFTMKNPYWYFQLLKIMNRAGFVNNSVYKFVHAYINNEKVRTELYTRWTAFRRLIPSIKKIKTLILENQTSTRLIYGKHDRIIRFERAQIYRKGIEQYCELRIINAGHQVLNEKHVAEIQRALLH